MASVISFVSNQTIQNHTEYEILIAIPGEGQWTFRRRYSALRSLWERLKSDLPVRARQTNFPPKKWPGNMKPEFIAQRQTALENYFRTIYSFPEVRGLPLFDKEFLRASDRVLKKQGQEEAKQGDLEGRANNLIFELSQKLINLSATPNPLDPEDLNRKKAEYSKLIGQQPPPNHLQIKQVQDQELPSGQAQQEKQWIKQEFEKLKQHLASFENIVSPSIVQEL